MNAALVLLLCLAGQDIDDQLKDFAQRMKAADSDGERIAAVRNLARTRHPKAAQKLAQLTGSSYSADVKVAAAEGVGRIGDPRMGRALLQVLDSYGMLMATENPETPEQQKVAEALLHAMGRCRDPSAVPLLVKNMTKNNIPLIGEGLRALAQIRDPSSIDQLVRLHYAAWSPELPGVSNPRKPLKALTLMTLRRLTGERSMVDPMEWQEWWKRSRTRFRLPPEESLRGLPPDVATFAVYSGKGEVDTLARFGLVFLDPANPSKEDLGEVRAIALSGEPEAVLAQGFAGFLVDPAEAAAARKKHPKALIVSRGPAGENARHVDAMLVDDLVVEPPEKESPEDRMVRETRLKELQDAFVDHGVWTLALFTAGEKGFPAKAVAFARGFLNFIPYVAPDAERSTLSTDTLR